MGTRQKRRRKRKHCLDLEAVISFLQLLKSSERAFICFLSFISFLLSSVVFSCCCLTVSSFYNKKELIWQEPLLLLLLFFLFVFLIMSPIWVSSSIYSSRSLLFLPSTVPHSPSLQVTVSLFTMQW